MFQELSRFLSQHNPGYFPVTALDSEDFHDVETAFHESLQKVDFSTKEGVVFAVCMLIALAAYYPFACFAADATAEIADETHLEWVRSAVIGNLFRVLVLICNVPIAAHAMLENLEESWEWWKHKRKEDSVQCSQKRIFWRLTESCIFSIVGAGVFFSPTMPMQLTYEQKEHLPGFGSYIFCLGANVVIPWMLFSRYSYYVWKGVMARFLTIAEPTIKRSYIRALFHIAKIKLPEIAAGASANNAKMEEWIHFFNQVKVCDLESAHQNNPDVYRLEQYVSLLHQFLSHQLGEDILSQLLLQQVVVNNKNHGFFNNMLNVMMSMWQVIPGETLLEKLGYIVGLIVSGLWNEVPEIMAADSAYDIVGIPAGSESSEVWGGIFSASIVISHIPIELPIAAEFGLNFVKFFEYLFGCQNQAERQAYFRTFSAGDWVRYGIALIFAIAGGFPDFGIAWANSIAGMSKVFFAATQLNIPYNLRNAYDEFIGLFSSAYYAWQYSDCLMQLDGYEAWDPSKRFYVARIMQEKILAEFARVVDSTLEKLPYEKLPEFDCFPLRLNHPQEGFMGKVWCTLFRKTEIENIEADSLRPAIAEQPIYNTV